MHGVAAFQSIPNLLELPLETLTGSSTKALTQCVFVCPETVATLPSLLSCALLRSPPPRSSGVLRARRGAARQARRA